MSVLDSLPLLVPVCGVILAISTSTLCCLRRQMTARFNILEDRLYHLEQKVSQQRIEPSPPQTFVQPYINYQQPSAPATLGAGYAAPQPFNPYAPQVYSI